MTPETTPAASLTLSASLSTGDAMQEILIDSDGKDIRVITFNIDDRGTRSVESIDTHGVPVDLETMANGSMIDPLHWKWSDAVLAEFIEHQDRAYLFNYRRLQSLDNIVELFRARNELKNQISDIDRTLSELIA